MLTGKHDISKRPKHEYKGVVLTAQIEWELYQLIEAFDDLAPEHILEIGTQFGGTLRYWLEVADDGAVVVNIDILQNMSEEDKLRLPAQWMTWAPVGVVYHCLIGRSDDPAVMAQAVKYLDGWLDFLWIDADHSYEGTRKDFEAYGPLVKPGGIIALHDIKTPRFAPHIQVSKLWREIQAAGYVTCELDAGAKWGGIGLVYV